MGDTINFDYYYGIEAEQFSFYRVPRLLIKDERFKVQFTVPSGLHSVLGRPFSEVNGRPFLVKRSPLIVC